MASEEAHKHIRLLMKHREQVDAGLIPKDSPPDFVRPEGDAALVDALPWWYGGTTNYKPTPEALAAFSTRPDATEDDLGD